jgi:ABC-type glycerol-3-phosphate transport system substrate-binding protein
MRSSRALKRLAMLLAIVVVSACTASTEDSQGPAAKSARKAVTLNVWTFYTGRELDLFERALNGLGKQAPWI